MRNKKTEKPVFLPLMSDPFEDFERRGKKWEIGRAERQWNMRNIRRGRKITISCGYGKRKRLRGEVGMVILAPSL